MQALAERFPRRRSPLTKAFVALVPLIYGIETLIVRGLHPAPDPAIALAVTIDIAVFVPLLYWLLVVRPVGGSPARVVAAFVVSLLGARIVLPAHDRQYLALARYLVMPLELALVWWVAVRVRRFSRDVGSGHADADVPERIQAALVHAMPYAGTAAIFATEMSLLWYAFASWRREPHVPAGARAFSYHRTTGISALLSMLIVAAVAETLPLHFLVRRGSGTAAWILTLLSVLAVFWLVGLIRSVRLRPVLVSDRAVVVRAGLRWCVEIPRADIVAVQAGHLKLTESGAKAPGLLRATIATQPNVLLTLSRPVVARGMYGRTREATAVAFTVDDREALRTLLA